MQIQLGILDIIKLLKLFMREFINRSDGLWALIRSKDRNNTKLAIFIHGFRGSYLSTWGKLPEMIQNNADLDISFKDWDFLFVGFETQNIQTYLDISHILCSEWEKASSGYSPYNHNYSKLALFGHSLGTLGIRQMLCAWSQQPVGTINDIHSITLFGTPLNGSPWAPVASAIYRIADALKESNPQLRMLKAWSESAYKKDPWPEVRLILGQDDRVVGYQLAELITWTGDKAPTNSRLDHSGLVKPTSWNNSEVIDYIKIGLT